MTMLTHDDCALSGGTITMVSDGCLLFGYATGLETESFFRHW